MGPMKNPGKNSGQAYWVRKSLDSDPDSFKWIDVL